MTSMDVVSRPRRPHARQRGGHPNAGPSRLRGTPASFRRDSHRERPRSSSDQWTWSHPVAWLPPVMPSVVIPQCLPDFRNVATAQGPDILNGAGWAHVHDDIATVTACNAKPGAIPRQAAVLRLSEIFQGRFVPNSKTLLFDGLCRDGKAIGGGCSGTETENRGQSQYEQLHGDLLTVDSSRLEAGDKDPGEKSCWPAQELRLLKRGQKPGTRRRPASPWCSRDLCSRSCLASNPARSPSHGRCRR